MGGGEGSSDGGDTAGVVLTLVVVRKSKRY